MRAALGIRHSPLQDSRGCGGSAVGTKMLEIVNISGTGSCIDAKRNLSFFFKEREREISSFLTSRPRYYDEFLIIYAVFRATIFSFHFAPL